MCLKPNHTLVLMYPSLLVYPHGNNCSVTVPVTVIDTHLSCRNFSLIAFYSEIYAVVTEVGINNY